MTVSVEYETGRQDFRFFISLGNIVDFGYAGQEGGPHSNVFGAIVNPANIYCVGGSGADGAISRAGGESLHQDRLSLPAVPEWRPRSNTQPDKYVRCKTGNAVITGPGLYGNLGVPYVIHAVGPNYSDRKYIDKEIKGDEKLRGAYVAAMERAREHSIAVIACPLISGGRYRGKKTLHDVIAIALQAVRDHAYEGLQELHLVGHTKHEFLAMIEVAFVLEFKRLAP